MRHTFTRSIYLYTMADNLIFHVSSCLMKRGVCHVYIETYSWSRTPRGRRREVTYLPEDRGT